MSLYRKYRPEKFADLIGQDHVAKTLEQAVLQKRVGHSYLFSGPRGIGKTTVARILARSLNCGAVGKDTDIPCGKCESCKTIAGGQSVDILEIDAASNRGIDEIRELREKVRFAPTQGQYKVYIIDEVHMLTKEAFNALLKTLEEPPAHAVFILATTESHKVPATIVSRCQRFDFRRATLSDVIKLLEKVSKLEKMKAEPASLALIARAADGAYRDALTLLEQMSEENTEITAETVRAKLGLIAEPLMWQLLSQVIAGKKEDALTTFSKLSEQGIDWKFLISGLMQKLRQLLFYEIAPSVIESDITAEEARQLKKLSTEISEQEIVALINLVLRAEAELRTTSMPELPLGAAIVEYMNKKSQPKAGPPRAEKLMTNGSEAESHNASQKSENRVDATDVKQENGSKPKPKEEEKKSEPEPKAEKKKPDVSGSNAKADASNEPKKDQNNINYNEIRPISEDDWKKIIALVKKENATFAGLLNQSSPFVNGDKVVVEVPYSFWEEKIKNTKNSKAICEAACEVLGQKIEYAIPKSNGDLRKKIGERVKKESAKTKTDIEDVFGA